LDTILGVELKNRFISFRWKMLSTYLILILILFFLLTSLIPEKVLNWQLEFRKDNLVIACEEISQKVEFYLRFYDSSLYGTYLDNLTKQYSVSLNSRVMIYDKFGRILSDSYRQFDYKNLDIDEINESLKDKIIWNTYYFRDFGNVIYLSYPVIYENEITGGIFISNSINELFDNAEEINNDIRLIIILIGILIIIGTTIISNHFLKPINKFYPVLAKLSIGDFSERVEVKTNDEFKLLANSFNGMSIKLNEVDQQRKEFVGNVSHELKTPLSSMKLLSESLLLENEKDINIYREFLYDINNEVDRLNNIVSDLLTLVDLDKKQLILNYQPAYLNYLVEKIVEQLRPLAEQKNITLKYEEIDSIQIKLDKDKIKQSIINIIHNGIKYTPEYGSVKIELYKEKDFAVIKIADNGYGISEKNLPYIFDRFYRVDKARSRNTGGTGLGLSISKQIVNLHHGTINVTSEVGKGTIFYIKLPII
jgi:signal transduction histidine kinase